MNLSMRARSLALVIAAALLAAGLALAPPALREAAAQADAPALWSIRGPNGNVYLFGSFHLLPRGVGWRTPALRRALDEAQSVVLETDLTTLQDPQATQALIAKFGLLPQGQTLPGVLGEPTYAALERTAAELKMRPAELAPFRP